MPIPKAVARFNRYVTNPIARQVAGWAPGFCILTHVGRRSGRPYRTPLNVFAADGGYVFALTYGSATDWVENVLAAGQASMLHRRRQIALTGPRFLATQEGMGYIPWPARSVLDLLDVTEFLYLEAAP